MNITLKICFISLGLFFSIYLLNGFLYMANNSANITSSEIAKSELELKEVEEQEMPTSAASEENTEDNISNRFISCNFIAVLLENAPKQCVKDGSKESHLNIRAVPDAVFNEGKLWFSYSPPLEVNVKRCESALHKNGLTLIPTSISEVQFADSKRYAIKKWVCMQQTQGEV